MYTELMQQQESDYYDFCGIIFFYNFRFLPFNSGALASSPLLASGINTAGGY